MARALFLLLVSLVAVSCSSTGPGELRQNADEGLTPGTAPPPSSGGRLPALATPRRYRVVLDIDPAKASYTGDVTIEIDVPRPTRAVVLNARGLSVTRATANVGSEKLTAVTSPRKSSPEAEEDDELVLGFPRDVSGPVTLHLGYVSSYADGLVGLYRVKVGDESYVFSQFEPMDARRAFPCFDEPFHKTPWDVVVRTPEGNVAIANTREVTRTIDDDKKSVFTFATTEALPTYLLAFAVGPLETLDAKESRVPLRVVTTKGKSQLGQLALDAAKAQLDILEKYFDAPYPFDKLDLVAVPDFAAGAMENAGLVMFREDLILVDPKQPSAHAERYIGLVLAHELAHQWFGNWVTMTWWDDLWLAEGFATWMESKVVDAWRPQYAARTNVISDRSEALELDARPSARPVRRKVVTQADAEEAFDPIVYDKGASIVAMLEDWVGEDAFRAGVRSYLKQHAGGSVRSEDLFDALTSASGKDVARVAKGFVEQAGVPLVSVNVACEKGHAPTLVLKQRMLQVGKAQADDRTWAIPFCVEYESGKTVAEACTLLEEPTAVMRLPVTECPKWIVPNANENTYARYAMSREWFMALANRKAPLSARTRFGMLESALALVKSGDQGVDTLIALLEALRIPKVLPEDPEERVFVEKVISVLREVKKTLVVSVTERRFDDFSTQLLLPLVKQLGFEPKEGESLDRRLIRRAALDAAYLLVDDPWLREEAKRRARAFLRDPRAADLDVASAALRIAAKNGDAALFDELQKRLDEPDPQIRAAVLGALGSFGDPKLCERALDLLLDDRLKRADGRHIIRQASILPASNKIMLGWMARRHKDLKQKLPLFVRVSMLEQLDACDDESAAFIKKEVAPAFDGPEGGAYAATQAIERATLCADLRKREADRMRKRFGFRL